MTPAGFYLRAAFSTLCSVSTIPPMIGPRDFPRAPVAGLMRYGVAFCIVLLPIATPWLSLGLQRAEAQSQKEILQAQKEILQVIGDFADRLCEKVPLEGSGSSLDLSGTAKAQLSQVLKRLGELGVQGTAKYQETRFQGVLQKDLAAVIKNSTECKQAVFKELSAKLLPRSLAPPPAFNVSLNCEHAPMPSTLTEVWVYLPHEVGFDGLTKYWGKVSEVVGRQPPYRCRLTNYGTAPIFNVEVAFAVIFKDMLPTGHSGKVTSSRGGKIPIPHVDPGAGNGFTFWVFNSESNRAVIINADDSIGFDGGGDKPERQTAHLAGPKVRMWFGPYVPLPQPSEKEPAVSSPSARSSNAPPVAAPTPPKEEPALGLESLSGPLPKAPAIETPKDTETASRSPTTAALGVQDLRNLRATAMRLTWGAERDDNLLAIAQQAARQKEYQLAIEIAGDIAIGTTRNKALKYVGCHALYRSGDRAAAEAAAGAMAFWSDRQAMNREIVAHALGQNVSSDVACRNP